MSLNILAVFHSCDYKAAAVEHREHKPVMLPATTSTVILWRCKCGAVESEEIDGQWTLAQIRGEKEPVLSVLEQLSAELDGKP